MPATLPRRRAPLNPVAGSVRLLRPLVNDYGRIAVTSHTKRGPVTSEYDVQLNRADDGAPLGFALAKDDDVVYDLPVDLSSCDCGDHTFNADLRPDGLCKHQKALAKLRAEGKL